MTVHILKIAAVPPPAIDREAYLFRFADFMAEKITNLPGDVGVSGSLECRMMDDGAAMAATFTGSAEAPKGFLGGAAAEELLTTSHRWQPGESQITGRFSDSREIHPGWPVVFCGWHGVTRDLPDAVAWLAMLCETSGARVISTSYARKYGLEDLISNHPGVPLVGSTPWAEQGHKGDEIAAWFRLYNERRYVVIDTSAEAGIGHEPRFVRVGPGGLDGEAVAVALEILSRPL